MKNKLIIVIGAFGSGKSEYSINLAKEYSLKGFNVSLSDLDVVNPYFRSRDVREKFEKDGIEVIAPQGEYKHADLPMISPRIKGEINNYDKFVIIDVGGDPAGCRTLARYVEDATKRGYEMHFVVNTKRPFTSTAEEIIIMKNKLEYTSKLKITHLISNTNLMEFTDEEIVEKGISIVEEVSKQTNLIFDDYLVLDQHSEKIPSGIDGKNKKVLSYFLSKPWEMPILKGI
ncbi:MAG: hypothetical protein K8S23_17180 [Candidatus Cloacimonetes bacterium]|nr:hypothetical protein [Candidatus Cloacimonadota bacterium]